MTLDQTKRINTGIYEFTYKGRVFQVEDIGKTSGGECMPGWMAYEMFGNRREYTNDYMTKRAAVANTIAAVDEGY